MRKSYKASNFLDALDKYTKKRKKENIEDIKNQEELELRKAQEEILTDVNSLIDKEIFSMKNKISIEVAKKELDEKKIFFRVRREIMENMFRECKKRLIDFTKSQEYQRLLENYAISISKILQGEEILIFVKKDDLKYKDLICKAFGKPCEIKQSDDIIIGGIKGQSISQNLIVDQTFDTKLIEQEDIAIENFGVLLV